MDAAASKSPAHAPAASGPGKAAHWQNPKDVTSRLHSDPNTGLSDQAAQDRLQRHGPNEIEHREPFSWPGALARQFVDPLIAVLLVAAVISAAVGEAADAITIGVIVMLNGALGFTQEWRAERALAALAEMMAPHCTVIRDGAAQTVDARSVVPGDVLVLDPGARVAADAKLLKATDLTVDESPLTGESSTVVKHVGADAADAPLAARPSIVHGGTLVATGRAQAVVTATGVEAEFGRIAMMAATVKRADTPLQKRLGALGRKLGIAAAVMATMIAGLGLFGDRDALEMFLTGVSLAVAAVPEGLPAVVALSLTIGVRAMAKRNALVRRLRAAETLGSATIICTDKTGTLTAGRMSAVRLITAEEDIKLGEDEARATLPEDARAALEVAVLCNDATMDDAGNVTGSPTEAALLQAALSRFDAESNPSGHRCGEVPFSSERKRMTVVVERDGRRDALVKGAFEHLAPLCANVLVAGAERPMAGVDQQAWDDRAKSMGAAGLRVIALARRAGVGAAETTGEELERNLTLVGLIGLMDPPRPNARAAVTTAQSAGVRVMMITGDAPATAATIAGQVGLHKGDVLTGADIDALDDVELSQRLSSAAVLSRTTPEHKMRVVGLLQHAGQVVAMTGDGVNDAPALKRADIGVAMGVRGTDAAKAAADMVLLDDDFGTIVAAMREGRRQDDNIRKFVRYLLASNLAEVFAVLTNIISGAPLILKPVQILWMNLVTDGATALALGMERAEADVMARPPRRPGAPILDVGSLQLIAAFGLAVGACVLGMFAWGSSLGLAMGQTMALTTVVILSKASVLSFRSLRSPSSQIGWASNPWLLAAIGATLLLQLGAVYLPVLNIALGTTPLGWRYWTVLAVLVVPVIAVPELFKRLRRRSPNARQ